MQSHVNITMGDKRLNLNFLKRQVLYFDITYSYKDIISAVKQHIFYHKAWQILVYDTNPCLTQTTSHRVP